MLGVHETNRIYFFKSPPESIKVSFTKFQSRIISKSIPSSWNNLICAIRIYSTMCYLVFYIILTSNSKRLQSPSIHIPSNILQPSPTHTHTHTHTRTLLGNTLLEKGQIAREYLGRNGSEKKYNYSLIITEIESEASSSSPCHFKIFLSIKILI